MFLKFYIYFKKYFYIFKKNTFIYNILFLIIFIFI